MTVSYPRRGNDDSPSAIPQPIFQGQTFTFPTSHYQPKKPIHPRSIGKWHCSNTWASLNLRQCCVFFLESPGKYLSWDLLPLMPLARFWVAKRGLDPTLSPRCSSSLSTSEDRFFLHFHVNGGGGGLHICRSVASPEAGCATTLHFLSYCKIHMLWEFYVTKYGRGG